uniref:Staphylococcal nuclease domain-containing protein n=1 Tax=Panagrellus redivivus TaxID=6233 RepID=A0A7E4ZWC5_PANRE
MSDSPQKRGVVKQVLSGDAVVIQGPPQPNGPPKEVTVYLANIAAPRLARRPNDGGSGQPDEPLAWEAREFLRKKLIGQTVTFIRDFLATSGREHGRIYLGGTSVETAENVAETAVSEGLLEVRPGKQVDENTQKLIDLQEKAKAAKKGRWAFDEEQLKEQVRNITWTVADPRALVDKYQLKPVKAVIEQVRDGSTVRAFLLPDNEYVTIQLSGVKTPSARANDGLAQPFGEEARFFVEQRLLQRDVEVVLESVSNQNFIGSVIHPRGNIAVFLLQEGYAKCVDWSIGLATGGPQPLRDAEKIAKEKKLRLWRHYVGSSSTANKKAFSGIVTEIGHGDSITVQTDDGTEQKIYLASIRPPRKEQPAEGAPAAPTNRKFSPLYDIPFLYETREYLRKKLLGKKVDISVDYVQAKTDLYPEKTAATVTLNGKNIAVELLEKGLVRVVRHRNDDDNRASDFDALLAAEANAEKEKKGQYAEKKGSNTIRIVELQNDLARSKQFLPAFERAKRSDAIVEFVSSGSRLRLYVPKENVLLTFLLGGISCPRGARLGPGGKPVGESEPFAEEALAFTKKHALQRDVKIEVENLDKNGGFIGYLFVQNASGAWVNLSELLVENGLASVHFTAERGPYGPQLSSAERHAKAGKRGLWATYVEPEAAAVEVDPSTDTADRKVNYRKVVVTEVVPRTFRFAVQAYDDAPTIEKLMTELAEVDDSTVGTLRPKKNEIVAVKYNEQWHRAKVESIKGDVAEIYYIDYGNRETLAPNKLAPLPAKFRTVQPLAKEYTLALVGVPNDDFYAGEASSALGEIVFAQQSLLLNPEYKINGLDAASLVTDDDKKEDIAKILVTDGFALAENRREKRFAKLVEQYAEAEKAARKSHKNIWQYGDFTGNEL